MSKLFDFKLIFIAIFLLLTIAVKNCENFQLRDLDGAGSEASTKGVSSSKTKIRFPFRKLEKISSTTSDEDEDDEDDEVMVGGVYVNTKNSKFNILLINRMMKTMKKMNLHLNTLLLK